MAFFRFPVSTLAGALASAVLLTTAVAQAGSLSLPYTGRLVGPDGAPVQGPVDVVEFFPTETGGTSLVGPQSFPGTELEQGVFHITMNLSGEDLHRVFRAQTPRHGCRSPMRRAAASIRGASLPSSLTH